MDWADVARAIDRHRLVCHIEVVALIEGRTDVGALFTFAPERYDPVHVFVMRDDEERWIVGLARDDYSDCVKADEVGIAVADWAVEGFRKYGVSPFSCDPCGRLALDAHKIPADHPGGEGSACDHCAGVR